MITPKEALKMVVERRGRIAEAAKAAGVTYVYMWQRYKQGREAAGIICPQCRKPLDFFKGSQGGVIEWECRNCNILCEEEEKENGDR